jgi:hypothetical protein
MKISHTSRWHDTDGTPLTAIYYVKKADNKTLSVTTKQGDESNGKNKSRRKTLEIRG